MEREQLWRTSGKGCLHTLSWGSATSGRACNLTRPALLLCSVSVRVRPLSEAEADRGSAWRVEGNNILQPGANDLAYSLDHVFDSSCSTWRVYAVTTEEIIRKVVTGINGTVFAYGQTSSGKTHTMRGSTSEQGIIPLAVEDVFRHIEASQDREFLLRVSYMEVSGRPARYSAC